MQAKLVTKSKRFWLFKGILLYCREEFNPEIIKY